MVYRRKQQKMPTFTNKKSTKRTKNSKCSTFQKECETRNSMTWTQCQKRIFIRCWIRVQVWFKQQRREQTFRLDHLSTNWTILISIKRVRFLFSSSYHECKERFDVNQNQAKCHQLTINSLKRTTELVYKQIKSNWIYSNFSLSRPNRWDKHRMGCGRYLFKFLLFSGCWNHRNNCLDCFHFD